MGARSGQMLSHYRLAEKIGEGGMGVVWRADDTVLSRTVAIKVLPSRLALDEDRRRMFIEEARLAASVSHGNIVQVHELGTDGDLDFIVMEYVDGKPLSKILHGRPLPADKVAELGLQVAQGLARAHRKSLIHRDLKPANILVTTDGDVKIVDFGLATLLTSVGSTASFYDSSPTAIPVDDETPNIVGTLPYMSPEQVQGQRLDPRSDIFSFGSVLYEMTSGQRPFTSLDPVKLMSQITRSQPRPVYELVPDVPINLHRIIEKSLAPRPADRYQHTDDVAVDLKRLGKELESGSSPSYRDLKQPGERQRLGSRRSVAIAAIPVALALVAWLIWFRDGLGGRAAPVRPTPSIVQLVTWPGDEFSSRISPDGTRIAFLSKRTEKQTLWVQDLSGGEPRQIARGPGSVVSHAWAPARDELAVVLLDGADVYLQVYPATGGPPRESRRMRPDVQDGLIDRWYDSMLYIVIPYSGLWRYDLESDSLAVMVSARDSTLGFLSDFDLCADQRTVVFSAAVDERQTLWSMDLESRNPVRLSADSGQHFNPRWIGNDCDEIVYSSTRAGHTDLWKMSIADRTSTQITFSTNDEFAEDVTADGGSITFRDNTERADLWLLTPSTRELTQWTADQRIDLWPSIPRGGNVVAFQRSKPKVERGSPILDAQILMRSIDSRSDVRIVVDDGMDAQLSPDGHHLAFMTMEDRAFYLWIANANTGHKWRISETFSAPSMYIFPNDWLSAKRAWTPSSDCLYFIARTGHREELRRSCARLQSSERVFMDSVAVGLSDLHVSPDGSRLAYVRSVRHDSLLIGEMSLEARVVRLDQGVHRSVLSMSTNSLGRLFVGGWIDDSSLVVIRANVNSEWTEYAEILRVGIDGAVTILGSVDRAFSGAAQLDRDNKRLYLTKVDDEGDAHNLYEFDLRDGSTHRLTNNQVPGVSFSGIELLPDHRLLFTRHERNTSIGVIRFEP